MKKQTMVQATFMMIVVGFLIKILGVVNRIVITRTLGETAIGVYMLISPTVMFLATLATVGLPVAIPALVSRGEIKERKILSVSLTIALSLSLLITIMMFFLANPIATYLLKDERVVLPLMMVGPLLCVVAFTSILKSYFQGKENMTPGAIATLMEQVTRIGLSVVFISWLLPRGIPYAVVGLMLASIVGELVSAILLTTMFIRFKKRNYPGTHFKLSKLESVNFKDVLGISLPTTGSRLVGTLTHFLEPIIVARMLFRLGYASEVSTIMYGAVSGFTIPLLFMPSFISSAVTSAIIPAISKAYKNKDLKVIHKRLSTSFRVAFFTSGFYLVLVMIFPFEIMHLLYNSATGAEFLSVTAPVFLLVYLQAPLVATLQAIGEAKFTMRASIVASIIKITVMVLLMLIPGFNIWGFVFAILINIVLLTTWYYVIVSKRIGYTMEKLKVLNAVLILGVVYVLGQHLRGMAQFQGSLLQLAVVAGMLFVAHSMLTLFAGLVPR
ncbi:MAG: polysaccharide biosynthesis protein [Defluviitaleaceae bacterium]|nr:polysaccharide biosynthesis protein [Defluviitaleaceae bacterium]